MRSEVITAIAELKPNPEALDTWATALESGRYTQIKGTLRRGMKNGSYAETTSNCMCVLGVGVETIAPQGWTREDGFGPCHDFAKAIGLNEFEPFYYMLDGERQYNVNVLSAFASANDNRGETFEQLAGDIRLIAAMVRASELPSVVH